MRIRVLGWHGFRDFSAHLPSVGFCNRLDQILCYDVFLLTGKVPQDDDEAGAACFMRTKIQQLSSTMRNGAAARKVRRIFYEVR